MPNKLKDIKTPFFALAPMANISNYPFASHCAQFGADLVWTPMVHTDTILNNWDEAARIIDFKEVKNYVIQIVGSDPEKVGQAIETIMQKGLKPIAFDINCGCPDKSILKSGCGGFLLKNPDQIAKIAESAIAATELPVSIKTRAGYDNLTDIYELSQRLATAGVSMLTIHPRKVTAGYAGEADWQVVKNVKEKLKASNMLIVGSGDVKTWQQALERQKETGCDGVMIGRGAWGKPWIFKEIKDKKDFSPDYNLLKDLVLDLSKKADEIWGDKGIIESRKHYGWYFRGVDTAKAKRVELMKASTLEDVERILS